MYRKKSILFVFFILIFALSACNLPSSAPTENPTPDLALTVTALAGGMAGNDTPAAPANPQETATPQFTTTAAFTPTPSVPQVTVSVNTNCRTGPGVVYDNIGALLVGQVGTVIGKNSQTGYWIINNPGKTGACWLYPQYATVSGNTANLQEYSIPPTPTPTATSTPTQTPTPSAPAPVNNVIMEMTCPNPSHSGTLKWEDKSNNEDGFNIYINGSLVASIPANSTSYAVAAAPGGPFPGGIASLFEVEAFNAAGKAAKKSVSQGCP
ncbi:MAG: hypothetical protein HXY38_03595 [Chloroflexi bacterium]|nr:hypothetical protein [Chloroflexota bacterium]